MALAALVVVIGLSCVASALAAEPPQISAVAPLNGQALVPQGGIEFEVTGPPSLGNVYLEVADENSVEPEGQLLSSSRLEGFTLESKPGSGTYSGKTAFPPRNEGWSFTTGTYYWQVSGNYIESSESLHLHLREMLSPVYTLVIAGLPSELTVPGLPMPPGPPESSASRPSPSTLAIAEVRRLVSVVVRKETGRSPLHLAEDCAGQAHVEVVCETTWLSAWPPTFHASRYQGKFTFKAQSDEVRVSFDGTRGRWGCVRRVGSKRCAATVRWSTAITTAAGKLAG